MYQHLLVPLEGSSRSNATVDQAINRVLDLARSGR